jgi:hypothetical protein
MEQTKVRNKFVASMLDSASKKAEEPKPNVSTDVNPSVMEPIMKDIQNKIQRKK